MGMIRLKLIRLWDKIARYAPFMRTIKYYICTIRWAEYERKVRTYKTPDYSQQIGPKVLVLMGTAIGDTIQSTPLVNAIRMFWPKACITIRAPWPELFENWCIVDNIISKPEELKGQSFDHTFVTWGGSISLFKGSCQLGQIHHTEAELKLTCTKSASEYNIDMLRKLGYEGPIPPQYVTIRKLKNDIPFAKLTISLVPGGTIAYESRNKRWPYFEELTKVLLKEYPHAQILIIGTKQDQVSQGLLLTPQVTDLRGQLSLPETAWVLWQSDIAVGNDCGPMHIAATVQTPSIFLFGPACDVQNRPVNKAIALRKELPCAPCIRKKELLTCNNPICMNELTVDMVLQQVDILLKK